MSHKEFSTPPSSAPGFWLDPAVPTRSSGDKPPLLEAEPISPRTTGRYPHLSPFEGHVLLGNTKVQMVLAGMPPKDVFNLISPAILAFFEKRPDGWHQHLALGSLDLAIDDASYAPVGIDTGIDSERQQAVASIIYSHEHETEVRKVVTWRLDANAGRASVAFADLSSKAKGPRSLDGLELHLRPIAGRTLLGSRIGDANRDFYVVRHYGSQQAAIVGLVPLQLKERGEGGFSVKQADAAQAMGRKEAFEIYFDSEASARGAARAYALTHCQSSEAVAASCDGERSLARVHVAFTKGVEAPSPGTSERLFWIRDKEHRTLAILPAILGQTSDFWLPPGEALGVYQMESGDSPEAAHQAPLALTPLIVHTITFAQQGLGRLRLASQVSDRTPLIVALRSLNLAAPAWGALEPEGGVIWRRHPFLVDHWPADFLLAAGAYQAAVYRLDGSELCKKYVSISETEELEFNCEGSAVLPASSHSSGLQVDLGMFLDKSGAERWQLGAGLQFATYDAAQEADAADSDQGLIPSLMARDEITHLTLRVFPVTPGLLSRAKELKQQLKGSEDFLLRFSVLSRQEAPDAILELGCPPPGIDLQEYERQLRRLQPNALRLLGCESTGMSDKLLALMAALHTHSGSKRYLLTAESSSASLFREASGKNYRLYVQPPLEINTAQLLAKLKAGAYSVSAEGAMSIAVSAAPGANNQLEVEVKLGPGADLRAKKTRRIVLYSEYGRTYERLVNAGTPADKANFTEKIALAWPAKARWLRAELRGSSSADQNADELLATTAFMNIAPSK